MQIVRYVSCSELAGEDVLSFYPESQLGYIAINQWDFRQYLEDIFFAHPFYIFPESSEEHLAERQLVYYCRSHAYSVISGTDKFARIRSAGVNTEDFGLTLEILTDYGRQVFFKIIDVNVAFQFSVFEGENAESERYSIQITSGTLLSVTAYRQRKFCKDVDFGTENSWLWVTKFEISPLSESMIRIVEAHRYYEAGWSNRADNSSLFGSIDGNIPIDASIDELGLETRTYHCLRKAKINTIADVFGAQHDYWRIRGFGTGCARDLEEKMHENGFEEFKVQMK